MDYNELEPKIVFRYFKEISNIPHGSGNTEEISKYLMNFAKKHNLKAIYDSGRNIIIFKPLISIRKVLLSLLSNSIGILAV